MPPIEIASWLDCVSHPAAYYSLVAAGLLLNLYLFVTLKVEIRSAHQRCIEADKCLDLDLTQAKNRLAEIEQQFRDSEEQRSAGPSPASPPWAINLSKRSQVLRMYRRGDTPQQISSALQIPQKEVDLLVKVHRIVVGSY
jgi:hypothetical protein